MESTCIGGGMLRLKLDLDIQSRAPEYGPRRHHPQTDGPGGLTSTSGEY